MRALQVVSHGPDETRAMAAALGPHLRPGDFIALQGGLGAGKTLFVQGLCAGLGVPVGVRSPTFVLQHSYPVPPGQAVSCVHHFDLYRLEDASQLEDLGYEEFFWGDNVCLAEWAERAAELLPEARLTIELVMDEDPDRRRLRIHAWGERAETLLMEWSQDERLCHRVLH
ncbi:MAG: tRNA (adenosine(37)-N6)-threonylcarbamoyltransferase complex ATPase subunit type 1 TsaE [Candidatus Xenobia bacterium]